MSNNRHPVDGALVGALVNCGLIFLHLSLSVPQQIGRQQQIFYLLTTMHLKKTWRLKNLEPIQKNEDIDVAPSKNIWKNKIASHCFHVFLKVKTRRSQKQRFHLRALEIDLGGGVHSHMHIFKHWTYEDIGRAPQDLKNKFMWPKYD